MKTARTAKDGIRADDVSFPNAALQSQYLQGAVGTPLQIPYPWITRIQLIISLSIPKNTMAALVVQALLSPSPP